jgi:hypothetical protein
MKVQAVVVVIVINLLGYDNLGFMKSGRLALLYYNPVFFPANQHIPRMESSLEKASPPPFFNHFIHILHLPGDFWSD